MNEMSSIDVGALTAQKIITGVSGGQRALQAILPLLADHEPGRPVVLDTSQVEVFGGSALRHLLQGIRNAPQSSRSVAVLANLSDDNLSEAELVAEATKVPFISATLVDGNLSDTLLRGPLDDKVARTLSLVIQLGEADAQAISKASNESAVATVWNNRLVILQSMGILRERKVGKRKFYSPVVGGLKYGS